MGRLDYLSTPDVHNSETLATYIEQQTGTPWATNQDRLILKKKCNEFFQRYPYLDYEALCHLTDWCHRRRRRFSNVWKVLDQFRYAYEDGALPEVNTRRRVDPQLEQDIEEALSLETDSEWRAMISGTPNLKVRKEVLENWRIKRRPLLVQSSLTSHSTGYEPLTSTTTIPSPAWTANMSTQGQGACSVVTSAKKSSSKTSRKNAQNSTLFS